ncbi:ChaN family lipoprotein [Thauera sinica]|uniref:ChaN family lipoprotein n=1 Tax=Thauera sinica TaxID=2665146 RepID=A0ABW1AUM9_9RHOO|nr:ChaN family lipoprotein [Thauera sp. K11]
MNIESSPAGLLAALAATLALHAAQPAIAADDPAPAASSCLKAGAWTRLGGEAPRIATAQDVLPALADRDVILLGEQHDKADDHRWQLQTVAALNAMRPGMVIGFEAFPRRVQPVLDRWVAGDLGTAEFLDRVEWNKVWGMPAELYLPLFEFARLNRIPMVALNVERKLIRTIASKGGDAVADAEREGVSRPATPLPSYVDQLLQSHREHARMRGTDDARAAAADPAFRNFVDAQTTWDRAMAEALARRLAAGGGSRPLVVGIIGSGHLHHGLGVAHQLRDLGVTRIATLLPVAVETPCDDIRPGLADAVFAVPPQAVVPSAPPRLGVSLGEGEGGVHVAEVSPGSLAERSGFRAGDLIVELAGSPVSQVASVVAAIRNQPAGTWLPLRIRRNGESLELVVRFPARG